MDKGYEEAGDRGEVAATDTSETRIRGVSYRVNLDVFEGPIDLLLHLITRQRVDIYDVSLARITDEYLAAVGRIDAVDLETATGFLVVAATLLELKSARLLPAMAPEDVDPHLLEERDLLLARLVECATFREAGEWIWAHLERGADRIPRTVSLEDRYVGLVGDPLGPTSLADVVTAAGRALAPRPEPVLDTSHVAPITASVRDAVMDIAGILRTRGRATFEQLSGGAGARIDVVVRFLAILELFKAGAVDLAQADRFGDIQVGWTGELDVELLEDVEEYAIEGGTHGSV